MRRLPILLLSCLAACHSAGDDHLDVVFDVCQTLVLAPEPETTAEELAAVDAGMDLWNRLGDSRLTREEVAGAPRLPIHFDAAATAFHGVYNDEQGIIFVNSNLVDPHDLAVTISHEVGHAFGLWHIGERPSVMNPGNLTVEPNLEDRAALTELWGDCP